MAERLPKKQLLDMTIKPKKKQKRRLSILLTKDLALLFEQYLEDHPYWSASAAGVHVLSIGFKAMENGLEVDWHKPPQSKADEHAQDD